MRLGSNEWRRILEYIGQLITSEKILTYNREVFRDEGGGESGRVSRNLTTERTREAKVDVAQRHLGLVRVGNLKQRMTQMQ